MEMGSRFRTRLGFSSAFFSFFVCVPNSSLFSFFCFFFAQKRRFETSFATFGAQIVQFYWGGVYDFSSFFFIIWALFLFILIKKKKK